MLKSKFFFISIFLLSQLAFAQVATNSTAVPTVNEVVDSASMLKNPNQIRTAIRRIYLAGGPQLAVLTVKNLVNTSLEQYSIQVVDEWKLGDKEKDDGVLLLVVKDSRQIRIEVGRGLEGSLTDAKSSDVISQTMRPLFKKGKFDSGILSGIAHILEITHPDLDLGVRRQRSSPNNKEQLVKLLIFVVFILVIIFNNSSRSNLPPGSSSNHRWGDRSGYWHGGGGRGGFGGGGGGFSGGGSSGGW